MKSFYLPIVNNVKENHERERERACTDKSMNYEVNFKKYQ